MRVIAQLRIASGTFRMRNVVSCIAVMCALTFAGATARAQLPTPSDTATTASVDSTHHHHRWLPNDFGFAIGPGIGWQRYADQVSGRETALTAVGGFFRGSKLGPESKAGFVPTFKVTIFPTKVAAVAGDPSATVLGTLRLRPMMVGLGWFRPLGRTVSVRLTGLGGWSFNGLGAPEDASHRPEFVVASAPSAVSSTMTWETSAKLWYALSPGVSFITGGSFIHARPELTLADGSMREWNADHVRIDTGVAFTVYRWHREDGRK